MRVSIPPEYFELFSYLKSQDQSARIVDFPQYNYWGWYNYYWGGTSSGFLWYGIDQPITSRTFDVWSDKLEDFYWQLHYALNQRDSQKLSELLNKYNVTYLLFDNSLFFPEAKNSGRVTLENQKTIDGLPGITLEKQFGNLNLYKVNQNQLVYLSDKQNASPPSFFPRPNVDLPAPSVASWSSCLGQYTNQSITARNTEVTAFVNCGDELPLNQSYVIKVIANNVTGRPLLYKVFTLQDNRLIIDSKLRSTSEPQYTYVPNVYQFDLGIGINFSSVSFSNSTSSNQLMSVEISPTSTNFYESTLSQPNSHESTPLRISHPNQTLYQVVLSDTSNHNQLVLPQSFSPGWLAFYFDNHKIKFLSNHVLVNNWANGWSIPESRIQFPVSIYIFFWPQLLEFLGLLFSSQLLSFGYYDVTSFSRIRPCEYQRPPKQSHLFDKKKLSLSQD